MNDSSMRIRELLTLYRRTHYDVTLPDGDAATLRIASLPPPAIIGWLGADDCAVYLTACNPYSRALSEADNDARMDNLRDRLRGTRARWLEGRAGIPGESWREPSLLVAGLDIAGIDRLARDCAQNAALIVARGRHVALRLYRDDWRAHVDDADLEWAAAP